MNWDQAGSGGLKTPRINHACGTMKKEGIRYLLVAGGKSQSGDTLSSCEYFQFPNVWDWKTCENLPTALEGGQLINDPETGDLLFLGGSNGNLDQNKIYRLSDINGNWTSEERTMKVGRRGFSTMLVPDGIIDCNTSVNNKHDEL